MKTRNGIVFAVLLILVGCLGIILVGCGGGLAGKGGSITVSFRNAAAKSILPPGGDGALIVYDYSVSGVGPGGTGIPETVVAGTATFPELLPGEWVITATGRNAAGVAIGAGDATVNVLIGQTATADILVQEYDSPNGSYRLDLSWEPDIVTDPVFAGELKDTASVTTAQSFAMDTIACTANSTTTALHPGWYANVVRLYDAPTFDPDAIPPLTGFDGTEVLATGFAEAVRIAAGIQTHGTVDLHAVQGYGEIAINLSYQGMEPLILDPFPEFGNVDVFAVTDFSISADQAATFVWYLNGMQIEVGDVLHFDPASMFAGEHYRLDVLGFSVVGEHGGSGTWTIEKPALGPTDVVGSYFDATMENYNIAVELLPMVSGPEIALHLDKSAGPHFVYRFGNVPAGTYRLRAFPIDDGVWAWGSTTADRGTYWNQAGTWSNMTGNGTVITIPNPSGSEWTCNFSKL